MDNAENEDNTENPSPLLLLPGSADQASKPKNTKPRTGHLFKRGKRWYLSYTIEGIVTSHVLRDEQGEPVYDKDVAKQLRKRIMAPLELATQVEVLERMTKKFQDAKTKLAELEAQRNPALVVSEAWKQFEQVHDKKVASGTLKHYRCEWNQFADWLREKKPQLKLLRDVTLELAEEYAQHLQGLKLSSGTYVCHLNLLSLVFDTVRKKAKLTLNPFAPEHIERVAVHKNQRQELSIEQLRKLCQTAKGELRILFALGIYCGLRLGDCARLKWGTELDLQRGVIVKIPQKISRRPNAKPVIIPIHPSLRMLLEEIPERHRKHGEFVLPELAELHQHKNMLLATKLRKHFLKNGIQCWEPDTGHGSESGRRAVIRYSFHSLRHSFVSLCRQSGVAQIVVESLVGHSNPAMTRHYSHVGHEASQAAIALLPAISEKPAKVVTNGLTEKDQLHRVKEILSGLTGRNWKAKRDQALKLLAHF
jgi:integrase